MLEGHVTLLHDVVALHVHILDRDQLIGDTRYLNALFSEIEQGLSQVVQGIAICICKLAPDLLLPL
jgi:hypothetical protein